MRIGTTGHFDIVRSRYSSGKGCLKFRGGVGTVDAVVSRDRVIPKVLRNLPNGPLLTKYQADQSVAMVRALPRMTNQEMNPAGSHERWWVLWFQLTLRTAARSPRLRDQRRHAAVGVLG